MMLQNLCNLKIGRLMHAQVCQRCKIFVRNIRKIIIYIYAYKHSISHCILHSISIICTCANCIGWCVCVCTTSLNFFAYYASIVSSSAHNCGCVVDSGIATALLWQQFEYYYFYARIMKLKESYYAQYYASIMSPSEGRRERERWKETDLWLSNYH